jgi:hypothetical protein
MPCTVISRLAAVTLLTISAAASASSSDQSPRFLTVPVLGLRLPLDRLNVDKFPEDIRATCDQLADDALYTGQLWVFGTAKDAASTYYILTGYFKRRRPDPDGERRLYEVWDTGFVLTRQGARCDGEDAVETYAEIDPNAENDGNVPNRILRELARDLAVRAVRAAGGPERLRAAIKEQRLDYNQLPLELQEAFRPYFTGVK